VSDPIDIKGLDEYLKGSSDVSQRYRELGHQDVPPELDRRVLAEARAAVANEGAQRSRSWLRWSAPVALAASVVLVVTVVIESGVQKDTAYAPPPATAESKLYQEQPAQAPQFVPEAPAVTEQVTVPAPQPAAVPAPPARSLAKAEVNASANAQEPRASAIAPEESRAEAKASAALHDSAESQLAAGSAVAPVPPLQSVQPISAREALERGEAEAEADSDLSEVTATGGRTRRATGRTAGPRNTISGAALSGETRQTADDAAQAEHADPDKWLEEIRDLRRKGKIADADREWQLFVEAYPDFHVADDDIARKH